MITSEERNIARHCIEYAMRLGAEGIRLSLNKNEMDSCSMLNGELDKVSHSADRSIYIYLYVDGKYGTFSTNRLDEKEVENFISKAIVMVKMLGEDRCRRLPDPERTAKDACGGMELGLYDSHYEGCDSDSRLKKAEEMSIIRSLPEAEGYKVISEECEYAESLDDTILMDSQGFEGRHTETSFNCFSELTIQDSEGNRYSGYWWQASTNIDKK